MKLFEQYFFIISFLSRLFEMGFSEQLHEIISRLPEARYATLENRQN
jgi:superfamily II DNA/RNA helicase